MNQDNELARNLRQTIEFADIEIAKETDEVIKTRMIAARESLVDELRIVTARLKH